MDSRPPRPNDRNGFEIACICALTLEADAVEALFDQHWDDDGNPFDKSPGDPNAYSTGTIGRHNVVLAYMPGIGTVNASIVANNCKVSFPNIRLGLVIGIAGITPFGPDGEEIVLGDVIISNGILQYNFGWHLPDTFIQKDTLLDPLGRPNTEIRALLAKLKGLRGHRSLRDNMIKYLSTLQKDSDLAAKYPGIENDKLFDSKYHHSSGDKELYDWCGCDGDTISRQRLQKATIPSPNIHFGLIASGDSVIRSGGVRDRISAANRVVAFEMEGAGVWDVFPCVVIRGGCDYADGHKNKQWQRYAAATAASCMKAFLNTWVPSVTEQQPGKPKGQTVKHAIIPYSSNPDFIAELQPRLSQSQNIGSTSQDRALLQLAVTSSSVRTSPKPQTTLQFAIKDFQSILTDEQRHKLGMIGTIRDAQSVLIFTAQLERENQSTGRPGIASRLSSVLQSVHAFSMVVETFVSSHPEIAALVWGSVKLTMLIAVNSASYFEAISSLFMTFSKQCPRFEEYQALYPASPGLQMALCNFHASIIRCCKHVIEVIQRSWTQQLKKALFQSFEEEMKENVRDIRKIGKKVKEEITLAITSAQRDDEELWVRERKVASRSKSRLRTFMPKVDNRVREMKEMQMQQSRRRAREERQRLLEWLCSHDHLTPFREACKRRQRDTAEWICAVPEFIRWYEGIGPPLLWCSGKIGSGKTVLCANVINNIFRDKGCGDRASFFFVDHSNTDSLRAETMIRSIIRQVIDSAAVPEYVESQLRDLNKTIFVELHTWTGLLEYIIQQSTTFYILIDGIDECDAAERRTLLDALSSLAAATSNLRIFISSRDSVHLDLRSRCLPMERVSMSCDGLISDICAYIDATLQKRQQNGELAFGDGHLLTEVKNTLTQHADGMFLWVTFLIDELCTGSCDDDIRRSLRDLPKDLEETFMRALSRILSRTKQPELVWRAFRWVATAKRPLTLDELREAVSIDIGQTCSRPERIPHNISRIALWCENLLHIIEQECSRVQFAHSSIRKFLTTASLSPQFSGFHIDLEEADHFAGEICITYLHFSDFTTAVVRRQPPVRINPVDLATTVLSNEPRIAPVSNMVASFASRWRETTNNPDLGGVATRYATTYNADEVLKSSHPFLKYAATHWTSHSVNFRKERSRTWDLWLRIVSGGTSTAEMPWQELSPKQPGNGLLIWSHQQHHYALLRHTISCLKQYEPLLGILIEISATEGHSETVAILLTASKLSIDPLNNALQKASTAGHLEVIEQLLSAKAQVNAHLNRQKTALQAASGGGHLKVVERLLIAGADVNAAAEYGGYTALQSASHSGHLEVVELLLSAGADVNTTTEDGKYTALSIASCGGYLKVVEQLLSAGADVNAAAAEHGACTALQTASHSGYLEVVERLLNAGADVNAAAAKYRYTALQGASYSGYLKVVERLLDAGADVNAAAAEYGYTALQGASFSGYLKVVERLLSAEADVNAAAKYGGHTALQGASHSGYLKVVERLLSARADVNAAAAEHGYTALQGASRGGYLEVVEQLLSAGADVNAAAANYGYTALRIASGRGHLKVVERLLDAGAYDSTYNIISSDL